MVTTETLSYETRLIENLTRIHKATTARDEREVTRVLRRLPQLRRTVQPAQLAQQFELLTGCSDPLFQLSIQLDVWKDLETPPSAAEQLEATVATEPTHSDNYHESLYCKLFIVVLTTFLAVDTHAKLVQQHGAPQSQELAKQILIQGVAVSHQAKQYIRATGHKSCDTLNSKAFFAMALIHKRAGQHVELRPFFLEEYRTAVLEHNVLGQATLINQLLQSYIETSEHDLAIQFVLKTDFPEDIRSTAEVVRCLFNLGRIQAVRLEYSDSYEKLMTAVRKLPPDPSTARGFKILAHKHAIVVELLMGDVPDISLFRQPSTQYSLSAYEGIVQAVRSGDLNAFSTVVEAHRNEFDNDGTLFLIERLRHSVIKAGLRRINNAYSRISLTDIATKLGISSVSDTEEIVAQAIVDGIVIGTIDAESGCLITKDVPERYKTAEPAEQFHKRIQFCISSYRSLCTAQRP